jgi:hypothetical protein
MHPWLSSALARRLTRAIHLSALTLPALAAATCGGKVVLDAAGGGGAAPVAGAGGSAAACLTVTSTGAIMGPPTLQETQCFAATPGQSCPAAADALPELKAVPSCWFPVSVQAACAGPPGSCCYNVTAELGCDGRPFLVDGVPRAAAARAGDCGWADNGPAAPPELPRAVRDALVQTFRSDGLGEHASIASFGRFALELLAVGAPSALVAAAYEAALDEVRHTRISFGLASAFGGAPVGPGAFPFPAGLDLRRDLASFARGTAIEGCIRETLAALLAAERATAAADPAVRAALASIAEDEARHAELAWRTIAWALRVGGEDVQRDVFEVFEDAARHVPHALHAPRQAFDLRAFGVLDVQATGAVFVRGLAEVIAPCTRALRESLEPAGEGAQAASLERFVGLDP